MTDVDYNEDYGYERIVNEISEVVGKGAIVMDYSYDAEESSCED